MRPLEKLIREAIATGKYKCGMREVMRFAKGSKLILLSDSISAKNRLGIEDQAKINGVPVLRFSGSSVALGRICNRPYRISALSIKAGKDDEIRNIITEK